MNKPYILIARKSTEKQENSFEVQIRRAQAYAQAKQIPLILDEKYITTESGRHQEHRESIANALAEIKAGNAAGIIATKLDRLSRSLFELIQISQEIGAAGGDLIVLDQNIDTSTPSGRLFFHMVGAFAEFEREMIAERTREAKQKLRAEGKHVSGKVPYGYTKDGKHLVPVSEEQAVIKQMHVMRDARKSVEFITWKLNKENIPAKNGGKWHSTQVSRILNRQ